jgi:SPP1 gp7 family putative phage head morphogenesis protein
MPMDDYNSALHDIDVRHQIGLQRYSSSIIQKILRLLEDTHADVVAKLLKVDLSVSQAVKLQRMLNDIRAIMNEGYTTIGDLLKVEMIDLAAYEVKYQIDAVKAAHKAAAVQEAIGIKNVPTVEQLKVLVTDNPFQGRFLAEWGKDLGDAAYRRVQDAARIGYVEGESVSKIVARIRGTPGARFKDGVVEISKRGAEGLVRTAVNHTSNAAKEELFKSNKRVFTAVRWNSVLDARTTAICRARSGKIYKIDDGPRPPAHWGCRSTITAVLPGDDSVKDETYQTWLKRQDADFQDEVLGPTKAKLFRNGGVTMERFVNRAGDELTLDQLRKSEAAAFKKAGL